MNLKALCLAFTLILSAQQHAQKKDTVIDYLAKKKKYFPTGAKSIKLMKDNWSVYFKEDVTSKLNTEVAKHFFEIKLDSYGSIYPDKKILDAISNTSFIGEKYNYKNLESHSFYWRFRMDSGNEINSTIVNNKEALSIYDPLLKLSKNKKLEPIFSKIWDSVHQSKLSSELNKKINDDTINRVIFYIHGYNVPYSLAALQAINVYTLTIASNKNKDKILFVPVYWPSNDAKQDSLEQNAFSTANIEEYGKNGKLFLRYSNRCYFAAITLRKTINSIKDTSIKIDVISHSLGAVIVTSALINTVSKLHYNKASKLSNEQIKKSNCICKLDKTYHFKNQINYELVKEFCETPIPTRKINIFLSAAAIPGENTFVDANKDKLKNKLFYVTMNQNDEMLTKSAIRRAIQRNTGNIIKANWLEKKVNAQYVSATTLGCNYKCEAYNTLKLYNDSIAKNKFIIKEVSSQEDHDIFNYLQQKEYTIFFTQFINEK